MKYIYIFSLDFLIGLSPLLFVILIGYIMFSIACSIICISKMNEVNRISKK